MELKLLLSTDSFRHDLKTFLFHSVFGYQIRIDSVMHPRSSSRGRNTIASVTVTYGPQSFAVSGPTVWNTLPSTLRVSTTTLGQFQSGLKTILFRLAYAT